MQNKLAGSSVKNERTEAVLSQWSQNVSFHKLPTDRRSRISRGRGERRKTDILKLDAASVSFRRKNVMLDYVFWLALLVLIAVACFALSGCGAGGYAGGGISGLTSGAATIDAGQSFNLTATMTGSENVAWSVTGANCSGAACGTLTGAEGNATYTAPSNLTTQIKVTITAGVAGTSNQKSVAVTVNPDPKIAANLPAGTVGAAYAGNIAASLGTSPLHLSISASPMPDGLSYDPATGTISGTPGTSGTFPFSATVVDSSDIPFTLTMQLTLTIGGGATGSNLALTGNLPAGTVGTPYLNSLTATGGTGPYTFSLLSGALPAGLSLSPSTGAISGTPTTQGTSSFTAQVQDSTGAKASASFSITINPAAVPPLTLTISSLPNGTVGTPYSATIGVSGGTAPYACAITAGTLPAGLSLGAGCVVSGTPTTAGTQQVTVKVTDSTNPALTISGPISITIAAAAPPPLTLTITSLPNGTVGVPYSATIGVSGGTAPYSCTITSGTLPAGLTLGTGCVVSGTPTVAGTQNLTVKATDSSPSAQTVSGPVSITINPPILSLTAGSLPNGTVGVPYSATIGVTGGTSPYSCAITASSLPAGLTLGAGCVVSGTPTTAGTSTPTVKVTDSGNPAQTVSGPEAITIAPAAIVLTLSPPPTGTVGTPYTGTIGVSGGSGPYSCSITQGSLPAGLTLGANCSISGTPTTAGTSTVTVKATDSSSPAATATGPVTLVIAPAALALTAGSLPNGTVGVPYSATIGVSGGTSPYSCAITASSLPAGLTLGAGCVVSGTPTTAGTSTPTVKVTDSGNPALTVSGPESITIAPAALTLTATTLPNGTVGVPYTATIGVSGGTSPYSCAITASSLPAGLTLGAGCVVSGTPTTAGTSTPTVKVTDSGNPVLTVSGPESITIAPAPLTLTATTLPNGTVGVPYTATIGVSGGTSPYSCAVTASSLPAGLTLGAGCVVSGTPTTAGTSTPTVKVTDSGNPALTVSGPESITIAPAPLTLTAASLPNGTVGVPYTATIGVNGGTSPYSCAITASSLPAGLTLGAGCVVSGTPTTAGTSTPTVKVTDSGNPVLTVSGPESITIAPAALTLTAGSLPNGTVGVPYSATIGISGGTSPYSCAITASSLPTGLTLGAGCVVSGTPTTAGTSTPTVKVTDSGDPVLTVSGPEAITIAPAPLTLTAATLPNGTVGVPYSATIGVSGGTSPYSCAITASSLPAGLTLGAGCVVSGTPTTAGTSTPTVKVTDSGNPVLTVSGPESITIAPAPLTLTAATLPNGTVGVPYTATIGVSGGTSPYSCAITASVLPAGLTLGAGCVVSGTPTTAGTSTPTVKVTDSGNPALTVSGPESITIAPAPLTLTAGSLPNGTVGVPYSATIGVAGGTSPYSCAITASSLPAGLTLGAGCVVSGTPTTAGTSTPTIKVTDSGNPALTVSGPESITIAPAPLTLTASTLPNGTVGVPYTATIGVSGGTSPYSCAITASSLPAGLTLGAGCVVSGTPTTAGTSTPTVKVTDSGNPALTVSGPEAITIAPAPLALTAATLPNGTVGVPYSATIGVSGGTSPYSCSITASSLPAGLTLGAGCVVSGTPTTAGTSTPTVKVTDSGNPVLTVSGPESITIAPAPLTLTAATLPNGTVGVPYTATIGVSGGTSPYSCAITASSLPAGLTLGAGCVVSGTPTTAGTSTPTVKVTDSGNPALTVSGPESITIAPAPLALTTTSLPNGMVGTPYSATIGVSGGISPYNCTIASGTLPAGLSLGAGCVVTGTPTIAGTSNLSVTATDSNHPATSTTGPVSITITPATLTLTASSLPNGMVGTPYSATIGVTGGTGPYNCVFTSGALPAGLSLGAGCVVSGTPTAAGTSNLTVKVTDSANPAQTVSGPESITIAPATLTLTLATLPDGTVGTPYSATIGVNGGTAPYSCVVTSGALPAGLTLGAGCLVSGTPTLAGTAQVTVKATDSGNPAQTVSGPETITIANAPPTLVISTPPPATVGMPYTGTIPVTGGTGPYSCTITQGSLPAGLNLGANCTISGTPTTAGPVTVTVKVTDSSNPQGTTTGPVTITVNAQTPTLTLGTPSNPTVGTPYTGVIPVTGGTGPYSCTITVGTLPAGLSLGANCTITGTPTTAGPVTVTVKATDSSTPQGTVTGPVTITVLPVPPLTLTGSLPNATLGVFYTQTLQAQGGIGPYTYTITAGSLPAGLSLSATGVISGTPTAIGASSFTVTAVDSETTAQTANLPLVLLVVYPTTPNDPEFKGPYAYLFQGYDDAVLGVLSYRMATIGSFTADGTGVISGGELDSNHQISVAPGNTIASDAFLGTYTIGSDHRGSMAITIINPDGTTGRTFNYAITLKAPVSPATTSAKAEMIESDSDQLAGQKGSGTILAQTVSSFTTGLSGTYAFGLSGDTPCLLTCGATLLTGGPVAAVGEFTANGSGAINTGSSDANVGATNYANSTLSGTYGSADGNGRLELSMTASAAPTGYPTDYAVYMVSSNYAFVMSTDKHSAFALLAGTTQLQTQPSFTNASMSGPYVGFENSPTNPGLVGQTLDKTLNLSTATVFQGTANGSGQCTTNKVDIGGLNGVVSALTGLGSGVNLLNAVFGTYASTGDSACTVTSNGRGVLAYPAPSGLLPFLLQTVGLGDNPPPPRVFYLVSPTQGYFLETGYAGLGEFDPQTGGPFTRGTLNGTYVYGTTPGSTVASVNAAGTFISDGNGHVTSTTDTSVGVGTLNVISLGVAGGGTYALQDASEGRYTFGTSVIYAISPGRFVLVDESVLQTSPSVALLF